MAARSSAPMSRKIRYCSSAQACTRAHCSRAACCRARYSGPRLPSSGIRSAANPGRIRPGFALSLYQVKPDNFADSKMIRIV
ncbi:Uncharacterised protein [Mycobacteroides abscessus subsp. abscessus]|nr:Uncharacterised protein [Mycobacteroides abscessus subsp. abscessus]